MRGRLIQRFKIGLRRLDPATIADVVPTDPNADSGYDEDFGEPRLEDPDDDGIGAPIRRELAQVLIPAQIEPKAWEVMVMVAAGNVPSTDAQVTLHFRDLEALSLVGDDGRALVMPGDRIDGIYDRAGALVQSIPNPPGLFVTEAQPAGWGLGGLVPKRNLLILTLADRPQAAP